MFSCPGVYTDIVDKVNSLGTDEETGGIINKIIMLHAIYI